MGHVSTTIDIDAPPEEVWAVAMDPDRLADWVTIHRKLGEVSDRPLREGSTVEQSLSLRGAHFKVHWTVTELEPRRRVVWQGEGPVRSRASTTYELAPDGNGGTRFVYENDFSTPGGPLGAAAARALVGGISKREAERTLKRLKELVESQHAPPGDS
jgi:uncharacterized protein YndB with AHSA1/START domain